LPSVAHAPEGQIVGRTARSADRPGPQLQPLSVHGLVGPHHEVFEKIVVPEFE
jgi:hypothetical protein